MSIPITIWWPWSAGPTTRRSTASSNGFWRRWIKDKRAPGSVRPSGVVPSHAGMTDTVSPDRLTAPSRDFRALRRVFAFARPYRLRLAGAVLALVVAAATVLALGQGLRRLIDD